MSKRSKTDDAPKESRLRHILKIAGPGVITGGADNDPAGIATYANAGATTGLTQLWLILLMVPLLIAVQGIAARLGAVTKLGLAELIRNEFGRTVAIVAGLLVIGANVATLGADLVGMASALQLVTHIKLVYFIVPLVVVMGYVTIFQNFKTLEKFMLWLIFVFLAYVVAGFMAHPDWGAVLHATFIPPIKPSTGYFVSAVGLLGTTITPFLFYWQTAGEREERRGVDHIGDSYIDIGSGMIFSNIISYFIILSTAVTLYVHHQSIQTAADAASALQPFAGPWAKLLFAVGIFGAGLMAIPILAVSTGYVVAGTLGWRMGLGRQAYSAPGFYSVIALAMLVGVELAISGVNPIKALFYSQVFNGLVAPILVMLMVILASKRALMGAYTATVWEKIGGWAAVVVLVLADAALVYSLIGGHGG